MALYLTLDRGYSASYAGLVASLHGLGGVVSSLGGGCHDGPVRAASHAARRAARRRPPPSPLLGFMHDPVAIAAVAFLVGMASNASRPAVQAMMADIVPARGPGPRLLAQLLGHQPRVRRLLDGRRVHRRVQLPRRLPIEAGMTLLCAVVVFLKLPESRPVHTAKDARQRPRRRARDGAARRTVHERGRAVVPRRRSIFQQGSVGLPVAMGGAGFTSGRTTAWRSPSTAC